VITVAGGDGAGVSLTQIATILFTNAVEFTPPGGQIDLGAAPTWTGRGQLSPLLTTAPGDQPGGPTTGVRTVLSGAATRATAGTRVGFVVVDKLVRAHSGQVEIAGTDGGTKVVVTVPRPPASTSSERFGFPKYTCPC
jgi:signal transduction histidine kinase